MKNSSTCVAAAVAAILAAGCGTSPPEESRPSASLATSSVSRQDALRCRSSQLQLTAGSRISEATQQNTLLLVFRNVSATGCDMRGYPGIALFDSKGDGLALQYRQHGDQMLTGTPPTLVRLPPSGVAYSAINQNTCVAFERRIAVRVEVIPPDDRKDLALKLPPYPILGYCGPGDPGHVIDIAPVEPTAAAVLALH
jgi:Protein of unknown function (DUF4232)